VLGQARDPESSMLYLRVTATDPNVRMPFGQPALPADKINKIRRWIFQGAPWPQQWSFAPVKNVDPTQLSVTNEAWIKTPVDRFIMNRLDNEKLTPSPEADRTTLIRRVALDLTGIPPTPQEVDNFVGDTSATAYEKVVDRLLASQNFGERWARHWMDQARYSDSDGYASDRFRPNAWRWRDWVVDSMNQDQSFDQFTREQIAGDILPGATPVQMTATGFHRNALVNREDGVDAEEDRTKRVLDRASTVAETWLGLTMGCTYCHSHPYDDLKQTEFYQLVAFFNNADDGDDVTVQVPASGGGAMVTASIIKERTANRRPTYLLQLSDYLNPDTSVALNGGTPAVLPPLNPRGAVPDRIDLGNWLVRADNPLTPRVAVNTIWSHLFGRGIVASLDDFGSRAILPTHPDLLDWLANDFVKNGWKRKRVIKQIVMSATYRQSAALRADLMTADPENLLLARQSRIRVDAEVVPDISLAAAGLLSSRMGGPSAFPPLPPELDSLVKGAYGGFVWTDATGPDRYRRGMYTLHKRVAPYPNLLAFDWPSASVTVNGRQRTNTPLQSLATLHGAQFVEAAQALAKRVQTDTPGNLHDQIVEAFRLAAARRPTDAEIAELTSLFTDEKASYASDSADATKAVGSFALNGVPTADAAAWVLVASTILNLDEVLNRE
jgi:hypothetical protein